MRRALSSFAATGVLCVVMSVAARASAADAGTDGAATDSGFGTTPSPNNPTIPLDSGTTDAGASSSSGSDSGGCSVVTTSSSDGWSAVLGLVTAASILVLSRRGRGERGEQSRRA